MNQNKITLEPFFNLKDFLAAQTKNYYETTFLDKELLADGIEFYNLYFGYQQYPIDERLALNYAELGPRLGADLWRSLMPKSEEEVNAFYHLVPFYFFHDLVRFMDGIHHGQADEIIGFNFDNILDFGGGSGGMSIAIEKSGKEISYYDTSIICRTWMKWLVDKRKLKIKVLDKAPEAECHEYGLVVAKDIAEHVIDPGSLYRYFLGIIKPSGKIIFSQVPCCGPEEFAPMHFKVDMVEGEIVYNIEDNLKSLSRKTWP